MNKQGRKVPIKNILYMYSYVWDKIDFDDYTFLNNMDDFDSPNILSTLFLINAKAVFKKGLYREYKEVNEELRGIKGKIDFKNSLNNLSFENSKSYCTYDEFNENNIINQIIKSTALKLYKTKNVNEDNRQKLNNTLLYLNNVDIIDIKNNSFNIKFNKNNLYTYYLIRVCELINMCLILSEETGNYKFIDIIDNDEIMQNIYELFVYKFYKQKLEKEKHLFNVEYQHNLNWNLKNGNKEMLPKMKLDILLANKEDLLIIDTKYYKEYVSSNYDKNTFISGNMYQMISYMNNINAHQNMRGILLYPLPYNLDPIDEVYDTSVVSNGIVKKTKLEFVTIDLSQKWEKIEEDLLNIVYKSIGSKKSFS